MKKKGFYINMASCLGCKTCQMSCKDKNNLPIGTLFRIVRSFETSTDHDFYYYSSTCNHCKKPKCVKSCPTGAMYISADGTVQHDPDICVRCRYCVSACPYNVPQYIEQWNKIGKCDACKDFSSPICADACPAGCIEWGLIEELHKKYANDGIVSDIAILPSSEITEPSTIIKPKKGVFDKNYTQKGI